MTEGKRFEEQSKMACKKHGIFFLRLQDAGGWNRGNDTRFTVSNLCDCIMHYNSHTLLVELKTHLGKSIPKTALKQADEMAKIEYTGVLPLLIINFRSYNETYLINAKKVIECLSYRKSLDLQYCRDNGLLIPQTKKRVNWDFDIKKTFEKYLNNMLT